MICNLPRVSFKGCFLYAGKTEQPLSCLWKPYLLAKEWMVQLLWVSPHLLSQQHYSFLCLAMVNALYKTKLWGRYHCHHITDGKREAQRIEKRGLMLVGDTAGIWSTISGFKASVLDHCTMAHDCSEIYSYRFILQCTIFQDKQSSSESVLPRAGQRSCILITSGVTLISSRHPWVHLSDFITFHSCFSSLFLFS